jgi:DNA-binding TFAR19-related protein (PDSD5 family)
MMTRAQREAEGQRMDARRNALEAAATLAPQISDDELKAILEEIENVNSTDNHNDSP